MKIYRITPQINFGQNEDSQGTANEVKEMRAGESVDLGNGYSYSYQKNGPKDSLTIIGKKGTKCYTGDPNGKIMQRGLQYLRDLIKNIK